MFEIVVRLTLWMSFPLNLGAAYVLALPSSWPGQLVGLSASVDPVYRYLSAFLVALFGVAYAWLALQRRVDQPLLLLAATGKLGAFILAFALWISAMSPPALVLAACTDLAFALLWFSWLLADESSTEESNADRHH